MEDTDLIRSKCFCTYIELGPLTMRFVIDFQKGCAWELRMTTPPLPPSFWGLISTWYEDIKRGRSVKVYYPALISTQL